MDLAEKNSMNTISLVSYVPGDSDKSKIDILIEKLPAKICWLHRAINWIFQRKTYNEAAEIVNFAIPIAGHDKVLGACEKTGMFAEHVNLTQNDARNFFLQCNILRINNTENRHFSQKENLPANI